VCPWHAPTARTTANTKRRRMWFSIAEMRAQPMRSAPATGRAARRRATRPRGHGRSEPRAALDRRAWATPPSRSEAGRRCTVRQREPGDPSCASSRAPNAIPIPAAAHVRRSPRRPIAVRRFRYEVPELSALNGTECIQAIASPGASLTEQCGIAPGTTDTTLALEADPIGIARLTAHFGVNFITFPIPGVCDVSCVVQYTLVSSTAIP